MSASSTGPRTFEAQASSSRGQDDHETDSDGENDTVNLTLDHAVLSEDPLGDQPKAQLVFML